MTGYAWLLPALPAVAALIGMLFGRRLPGGPAPIAIVAIAASTVLSFLLAAQVLGEPGTVHETSTRLTPTGSIPIVVGTRVDGLAATVAVMVCIVALLVQVYSVGYMHGDPRTSSYHAFVSLFSAAMLTVVLAADLFVLLVGWEVMGVCSYFLIGHYWETGTATSAAIKAFITTRIGDVGFLFGIFTLGLAAGSFRISDVLAASGSYGRFTITAGTLLLICGVVGKSAQFPLHVWLPDAMAGPTPISALIHAATMVAAGVFVVARLYPVFANAPVALDVLGVIAAITMLLSALVALVHDDLKKVLAWSTVSQLAYMVGGLAVGGYAASTFHLLTHAAFKALLFLAAGSVLHAVGTNLMSEMGGLRKAMPITFGTMVVGGAALAGLPPLSGAFSKDAILDAAFAAGFHGAAPVPVSGGIAVLVYVVGIVTALLTAAYVTRMIVRVFFGAQRGAAVAHESPLVMTGPLVLLAVAAAGLGVLGHAGPGGIGEWVTVGGLPAGVEEVSPQLVPLAITLLIVVAAAATVVAVFRREPAADPARVLGPAAVPMARGFYIDDLYLAGIVRPVRDLLARDTVEVDNRVVDGVVNGSGSLTRVTSGVLRRLQNGNVQAYATGMFVGIVALTVAVALR